MDLFRDIARECIIKILAPEPEPKFTPMDLIQSALSPRRCKRKAATKDRDQIKAARKQRQKSLRK